MRKCFWTQGKETQVKFNPVGWIIYENKPQWIKTTNSQTSSTTNSCGLTEQNQQILIVYQ